MEDSQAVFGRALVIGGYGTFGIHVSRELADRGVTVTVAGRNARKAEAAAAGLGDQHMSARVDVARSDALQQLVQQHDVVVLCAGPFSQIGSHCQQACLQAGRHYVDIADDRRYAASVRAHGEAFAAAGLTAGYGCSSLPSISQALFTTLTSGQPEQCERVRVTLFIGNDNRKGAAAVLAAADVIGRPIEAPQGCLRGFQDPEVVTLPPPFGNRTVRNFESPDYDLLPADRTVRQLHVKAGFESALVNRMFGLLANACPGCGRRLLGWSTWMLPWAPRHGSSGGVVMVECWDVDGSRRSAALVANRDGQRMAALPAVYVAQQLCRGASLQRGAGTASALLGAENLLQRLVSDGYVWHR